VQVGVTAEKIVQTVTILDYIIVYVDYDRSKCQVTLYNYIIIVFIYSIHTSKLINLSEKIRYYTYK